ncbi:MAG: HAMP domain-containing sensor histidine kinase [Myxococcota bacterium]
MSSVRAVLRAWLVAVISRRRGKVRALRDVQHLSEVLRFVIVFAVLMLLPTGFLAWQALNGIAADPAGLDSELQRRARTMAEDAQSDLRTIFERFETATLGRLERAESVTSDLSGLDKDFLKAAFRFDGNGQLVAPFEMDVSPPPFEPPAAWREAARFSRSLERENPLAAFQSWRQLTRDSPRAELTAESLLGEIRALTNMQRFNAARERAAQMFELGELRGRQGIRMDHLGQLTHSEIRLIQQVDIEADRGSLEDFATDLLTEAPWALGRHAEPALVRRILALLQSHSSPEWLADTRRALNERDSQLAWAESIQSELDLVNQRLPTELEFRYSAAQQGRDSVWAMIRQNNDLYAFSFSAERLKRDVALRVKRRNAADPDLTARIVSSEARLNRTPLVQRDLTRYLSFAVVVDPTDPKALAAARARRRNIRAAVVLMAVLISVVGVVWVARMLALEVEAARQRASFAANVSHELRSPITQIRLKGEALQLGLVDPGDDMKQHFDAIVRESERLTRLVDNVLDFASIERGAKRYRLRKDDDALRCIRKAIEAAKPLFAEQGLPLHVELPSQLPPLYIDREAIGQVLDNLLSNAAKYGATGPFAEVRVQSTEDFVEIVVSDRGLGIRAKDLPFVFDDFFRSQDPNVRRRKGTGIGLAIVRYIVEAHGGTIDVHSTPGQGATFTVRLPWQPPVGMEA